MDINKLKSIKSLNIQGVENFRGGYKEDAEYNEFDVVFCEGKRLILINEEWRVVEYDNSIIGNFPDGLVCAEAVEPCLNVKILKLHKDAVIPFYAKDGDAGMDLTAISKTMIDSEHIKYGFGLAIEIPKGYVGYIFARSSCYKQRQVLSNCVGVIDSGYRGEISAVFVGNSDKSYNIGERVAQIVIMPYPKVSFEEVKELSKTERGEGGYGHTGK